MGLGANQTTTLDDLVPDIQKIVKEYRGKVLHGIAEGIDGAADIFIGEAKAITVATAFDTGEYAASWVKKKMSRAKFVRYVGNSKRVKGKGGTMIPLINILEFTKRTNKQGQSLARPVVAKAVDNSKDRILKHLISKI